MTASPFAIDWGAVEPRVPARYFGVWYRTLLETGDGQRDVTTRRYWIQTRSWHADLRVRPDRPDFTGVAALHECSDIQLDWLCDEQGFAGLTRLQGDLCHWDRLLDSSLRDTMDVGRMSFISDDTLREDGVFARFHEIWQKLPHSSESTSVLERVSNDQPGMYPKMLLLIAGQFFIFMRDREMAAAPACRAKRNCAAGVASRREREAFADFEISFGRRDEDVLIIEASNLPWRERCIAFELDGNGVPRGDSADEGRRPAWRWHAHE
jgi:hypothetical protein